MKPLTLILYLAFLSLPLLSNGQDATINLRERTVYPGTKVYLDVSIYINPGPNHSFWIGTFPESAPLDRLSSERISYKTLKNKGTFQVSMQVPGTAGSYDFRLIHNGKVIKREKFKVLEYGATALRLDILTPNIQPSQKFEVKLTTSQEFPRTSRLGIYHYSPEKSEQQDGYLSSTWYYSRDEENIIRFNAPKKDGVYELRFFTPSPKRKMIKRVIFVVGNAKIPDGENGGAKEPGASDDSTADSKTPSDQEDTANHPPTDEEQDCKNGEIKLIEDQACKVTFTLPHPTKDPVFIQKPTVKTGEVPSLWADISQYLINALAAKNAVIELENSLRGRAYLQSTLNGIKYFESIDNLMVTGFSGGKTPTSYSDMSTGVLAFYLSALKASANGISGISKKINNLSVDVYWEVPYMTYSGKCVPQMVCKNGKWQPDFKNMKWVVIAEGKEGRYNKAKPNVGSREVAALFEDFQDYVIKVARDGEDYKPKGNNCSQCDLHLLDVNWPIEDVHCTSAKEKLALAKAEHTKAGKKTTTISDERKAWIPHGRRDRMKALNAENASYKAQKVPLKAKIVEEEKLIIQIKNVLENYEKSGLTNSSPYKQKKQELAKANDRLVALNDQLNQINAKITMNILELDEIEKGLFSKELAARLKAAQEEEAIRKQKLKEAESYVNYICNQKN